ncbi:MAG: MraY family glycosyltransferase [Cyanobacteriota bacterium]
MNIGVYQFASSFLLSFLMVALILPQLRKKLLDSPNQRSSHLIATPRGGGLAFVIIGSLFSLIYSSGITRWIPVLCIPLSVIGILDDYKDLPASWRYFTQVITATALILITRIDLSIWQIPVYIIMITAIINFFNFMDGLDGIVAGCSVFLFAATSNWALSGSIFGFLIWNWSPAKVFMGDVGSTFIGAVFAGIALQESSKQSMIGILLLGFPLFADAAVCVMRRLYHRKNIFQAHKQHLYQRLNQAGWSHSKVATLYIIAVGLLMVVKLLWGTTFMVALIIIELLFAFFLDQNIAIEFDRS